MKNMSLQSKIDQFGSPLNMLRNAQSGPYQFPIASEYSNWREEQKAWRSGVALMDQSFHMTDLYVDGKDALAFISSIGANSFAGFGDMKSKQLIACAPSGHLIGDMIIQALGPNLFNIIGRPTVANWIEYRASLGDFDVRCNRDERSLQNPKPRKTFRFELQGPKAWALLEKLNGGPIDQPRFFQMGHINVADRTFRSLRHGMGGAPGLEFWGPVEMYDEILQTILEAGKEFGLLRVGARAYGSAAVDSGWLPCPLPAIYAGEEMRAYREWLPAMSYDGMASLGGSYVTDNVEDYHFTPWDIDYGRLVKFDHDFVGKEALQKMANGRHRKKVSLLVKSDDAISVYRSQFVPGGNGKGMEMPNAHYAAYPYDAVISPKGEQAGISTYLSFIAPDNCWVGLAVVDEEFASEGQELTIMWGEPAGSPSRPTVEPHRQMELRATVSGWPFSDVAKAGYRP